MAPQGNIGLHLVCHGERTTAEVATQNKEERHTRVPMRPSRTVRAAPGGKVRTTRGREGSSRERREVHVEDKTRAQNQQEKEGASRV